MRLIEKLIVIWPAHVFAWAAVAFLALTARTESIFRPRMGKTSSDTIPGRYRASGEGEECASCGQQADGMATTSHPVVRRK